MPLSSRWRWIYLYFTHFASITTHRCALPSGLTYTSSLGLFLFWGTVASHWLKRWIYPLESRGSTGPLKKIWSWIKGRTGSNRGIRAARLRGSHCELYALMSPFVGDMETHVVKVFKVRVRNAAHGTPLWDDRRFEFIWQGGQGVESIWFVIIDESQFLCQSWGARDVRWINSWWLYDVIYMVLRSIYIMDREDLERSLESH